MYQGRRRQLDSSLQDREQSLARFLRSKKSCLLLIELLSAHRCQTEILVLLSAGYVKSSLYSRGSLKLPGKRSRPTYSPSSFEVIIDGCEVIQPLNYNLGLETLFWCRYIWLLRYKAILIQYLLGRALFSSSTEDLSQLNRGESCYWLHTSPLVNTPCMKPWTIWSITMMKISYYHR